MKTTGFLSSGWDFFRTKFLGQRIPIVVSWSLTNRCDSRCKCCGRWKKASEELTYAQIASIMDELAELGTRRIFFTGGEPLVREDIGDIVSLAAGKGIDTVLNTNGHSIPRMIDLVDWVNRFVLSLDGARDIHDLVRGQGSFDRVAKAVEVLKEKGKRFELAAVISKANVPDITSVLRLAEAWKAGVGFQPLSPHLMDEEYKTEMLPDPVLYRAAVAELIRLKKKGNRFILNSLTGLKHIYDWPSMRSLKCSLWRVGFRIDPNGDVSYCDQYQIPQNRPNCLVLGTGPAFYSLKPVDCSLCSCGRRVELNCLYGFNLDCLINRMRLEMPARKNGSDV